MAKTINRLPVYIGFDASLSDAVDVGDNHVVGIIMPEAWTTAHVSVLVSTDGAQFSDMFSFDDLSGSTSPTEFKFNVIPGTIAAVDPNRMLMGRYIKLRSGSRDAPVPQAETRMFTLITVDTVL